MLIRKSTFIVKNKKNLKEVYELDEANVSISNCNLIYV